MKRWVRIAGMCVLLASAAVRAEHILIWDNDNNIAFYAGERQAYDYAYQSFDRLLRDMGHQVSVETELPADLDGYDAVFVILGFACPG